MVKFGKQMAKHKTLVVIIVCFAFNSSVSWVCKDQCELRYFKLLPESLRR